MQLKSIEDRRSPIERMRRYQLVLFARDYKQTDINEMLPGEEIKRILKNRGMERQAKEWLVRNKIGLPHLGAINPSAQERAGPRPTQPAPEQKGVEVDAHDDLMRQFREQQKRQEQEQEKEKPKRNYRVPEIAMLRKECKKRGIKTSNTDNTPALRAKLAADDTAKALSST